MAGLGFALALALRRRRAGVATVAAAAAPAKKLGLVGLLMGLAASAFKARYGDPWALARAMLSQRPHP